MRKILQKLGIGLKGQEVVAFVWSSRSLLSYNRPENVLHVAHEPGTFQIHLSEWRHWDVLLQKYRELWCK